MSDCVFFFFLFCFVFFGCLSTANEPKIQKDRKGQTKGGVTLISRDQKKKKKKNVDKSDTYVTSVYSR